MKSKMQWSSSILAAFLLTLLCTPVWGEPSKDKTLSPYFFVDGGDPYIDQFPLKETDVRVSISGVIADVFVTQKYVNDGMRPINARYVFPASTQAAVHGLKMVIGEQVVTAKIKEREVAKQEFQAAKKEGKSASLLEQQRPNVFTMNVANIMPKDVVHIELHYTELLVPTEGTYEFMYPTVVGPRYSNQPEAAAAEADLWVKSPYLKQGKLPPTKFNIGVVLSAGLPIQELTCASHKVDAQWDTNSNARVSLVPSGEFGENRDFILKYRLTGKEIQSGLMLYQGEKENFFLLMVQPPERVKPNDIPPREYIFLLDVSGSMHGFPLATAKVLIKDLVSHLQETDKFNVVLFSGSSTVLAPSSIPATNQNIQKAIQIIDAQRGGGGTELSPALARAFSIPKEEGLSRSVIVITDGYVDAERDVFNLIQSNLNRSNVFSFGIGSSVNRFLVEGIAKAGLGEPFVVTRPEDAPSAAERFRAYVQSPVLTDVQIKVQGFDVYDMEPPSIPDLFAQRPLVVFGKWRGETKGHIEITGKAGMGGYAGTFNVSETKPLEAHQALRYLWARSRLHRLSDFAAGKAPAEHKEEVTALGLAYNLLTQHTSFVAVLESIRNSELQSEDVNQPLSLPLNVSNLAVGEPSAGVACSATPEPEMIVILPLTILALVAASQYRRRSMRKWSGTPA
jgi:Ca-activated chloride channel homolog